MNRGLALIAGGVLLGAVPATVMEFLSPITPAQDPATITAFLVPMLAGGMAGHLTSAVIRHRRR